MGSPWTVMRSLVRVMCARRRFMGSPKLEILSFLDPKWSRMVDNGPEWSPTMVQNGRRVDNRPEWSADDTRQWSRMVDDNGPEWSTMVQNGRRRMVDGGRAVEQAPVHSHTLDALGEVGGLK